ncbi:MAG: GH92 family glycosyl hydrolase, partial [bacterium]
LTCTRRAGFQRYTLPETDSLHVIIDLVHELDPYWDKNKKVLEASIEFLNDSTIQGYRITQGWAKYQPIYFYMVFSKPFEKTGLVKDDTILNTKKVEGEKLKAYVDYSAKHGEQLLVKTGISAVDITGAKNNLMAEIPHWDFDKTLQEASNTWRNTLSKIKVSTGDEDRKKIFYTAMYHSHIAPNVMSDVDGRYLGRDRQIHHSNEYEYYSTFSLWDTYRAFHPLMTIIQPGKVDDMIWSMIEHYKHSPDSLLPVWSLWSDETWCMIGYHAVPVILDAWKKGLTDIPGDTLLKAMETFGMSNYHGLDLYRQYGYIPADSLTNSVSRTLEYAYDDWCIAEMAKGIGKEKDYKNFLERSNYYKNLFDDSTLFMRGKLANRKWNKYDELFRMHYDNDYTEGNTWQYTWYVPHDVQGLISLMGSEAIFGERLDSLFNTKEEMKNSVVGDISGLIGMYVHGNEPSHHIIYLYNYINQHDKTQARLKQVVDSLYTSAPGGLPGNEDCGQMSAWYVLSSIGFYPVNPASGNYDIGLTFFDNVTIDLGNTSFHVIADTAGGNTKVKELILNGEVMEDLFLSHEEIIKGGTLVFKFE